MRFNLGAAARRSALLLTAVFLPCLLARASIVGPYTPDANTLYLFHFDGAAGSTNDVNLGTKGGQVFTVTNATSGNGLSIPPISSNMLGQVSYTGFGNCVTPTNAVDPTVNPINNGLIGYDGNGNGVYNADVQGTASADAIAITNLNLGNTNVALAGNSPFTLEALVCPTNIAASGITQEIICTDDSNGTRGFQFRINASGQLEFNHIPAPAGKDIFATIPTTGPNAFQTNGAWFHVAVTYDGANLRLYWTKLDPSSGSCNQIGADFPWACTNLQATIAPLVIGNENRTASGECFRGLIDEVRISNIARSPLQMMFSSPVVTIVKHPLSQSIDYFQPVTFSVTAASTTPMGFRWRQNGTPIASNTATNSSYSITNVDLGNAGGYDCVVTNTAGYSATSHVAQLVVGADHFLAHRWSFNSDTLTNDTVGGVAGTLVSNAVVTGGALVLDGTAGTYMKLPPLMLFNSNYTAATFEFWATYNTSAGINRVFDFGNTNWIGGVGILPPENYVYFAPNAGGVHTLGIAAGNQQSQESLSGTGNLDGQSMYVACVVDPPNHLLAIYTNGVLETSFTNETAGFDSIKDQNAWIGRSQFTADSYFNGSIDEFRIYSGALSPSSVAQSYSQGPNVPLNAGPVAIQIQPTNTTGAVGFPVSFIPVIVGKSPVFQWYENGSPVTGATNPIYTFTPTLAQNGHVFQILATNVVGGTNYNVASSNATLTVIIPPKLVWLGQNSSAWDTSTLNWTNVSTASLVAFSAFASAIFDDRGAGQPTVNLTQALNPVTVTANSTVNYSLISSGGNGLLTGTGILIKSNTATLIIDVTNNMTGPTLIAGGTLQIGNADTFGTLNGPVTNNASLVLDRSDATVMPSPIYGTGTVSMNSGNVTASGASFYTGNTFINSGVTFLANAAGLGATNGTITVNGVNNAELYITANVDIGLNPLILGGSGVSSAGALRKGGAGTTTCYGTVTLTTDTTLSVDGGATLNLTNSAGISGASPTFLTLAGSGAGNITGPLSLGQGAVTVNGGTWTVAPSNNFSGGVALIGGALRITGPQSLGPIPGSFNSSQIFMNGGTLEAATNITLNDGKAGITVEANSGITKDANATLTISNQIANIGAVILTNAGPGTLVLNGANPFNGTLFMDTGSQTASDGTVVIANNAAIANIPAAAGNPQIIFRNNNGGSSTLALDGTLGSITVAPDISLSGRTSGVAAIENLTGNNIVSGNFTLNSGGSYNVQSDSGTLTLTQPWPYQPPANVTTARTLMLMGAGIITLQGGVQDVSLLGTNVPAAVIKAGTGVLNLPMVNTYSGTTVVSNGVLSLTGTIGTNTVTVAGGLLVGNGTITGPVTVQPGGAIEAGTTNSIGTLNFTNTLTLAGNTIVKINKNTTAKDLFSGQTGVTYGGTLTVTNLAGTLTTNDTFILFSPGASASSFGNIVGSPGTGLQFTFTNGVLGVAVGTKSAPRITSVSVSGTTLTISGTNGSPSGQYVLLGSTNVALALTNWTPLLTNHFDGGGNINLSTNIINLALPQEFYLLLQ